MYDGLSELSDLSLQLQDRGLSLSTANSYIEHTIRIFDSMSNTYGPKTKQVLNAGDLLKFKDVPLTINKSVPKINPGQFFTSLANNMRSRLFTTQATQVSKNKNEFKDQFENILKDLNVLDPNNWPDNIDIQ